MSNRLTLGLRMFVCLLIGGCVVAPTATALRAGEERVDFNRDIRPILSNNCFQCHGFDENSRVTKLRLDSQDGATQDLGGYAAVVPGDPEKSELILRVTSTEESERMPPPSSNKQLTEREIDMLTRWVAQGAEYEAHWAFQPVVRPAVPEVADASWPRNEIDHFILSPLEAKGVTPSPEADRPTLIRRLSIDLLGLLPTPEEVDAFVADESPRAYENLVDRLLSSPHYGERWGRHWLDQARYADSHGYTIDGPRIMWPYRDWVIWALNEDLPFDQFTIEQLAGDLLLEPSKRQLIASAYHRNTMINQEGGVKPDQYRAEAIIDRVNTTGAVWLGLTVGCAQCHTHKFDPIGHDEYFRLYAFFNQCVDANNQGPTIAVREGEMFGFSEQQKQQLAELDELRRELKELEDKANAAANAHLASSKFEWEPVEYQSYVTQNNASFQQLSEDNSLLSDGNATAHDTYLITVDSPLSEWTAVRLKVLPHESLPKNGPGLAGNGNFVLTGFELLVDDEQVRFTEAWADHEQANYFVKHAIDGDSGTGWAINVNAEQRKQNPDLKMNAPHEAVFVLPRPLKTDGPITVVMKHDLNQDYLVGRFLLEVSSTAPEEQVAVNLDQLDRTKKRIAELEQSLPGGGRTVQQMVMRDQPEWQETHLFLRGDFLEPDLELGPLEADVLGALPPMSEADRPRNRLDLARWLVREDNPLTPRVTMNRIWMRYFGRGIVETENDFGYQGTLPTHPELLDWLADEFMRQGWSMKTMHRLIVTSATYRQSSRHREELARVDPRNLLLGRQERFHVEAEVIRDLKLAASGLLHEKLGGPSVFPPQPEGIYSFTQNRKNWPEEQGPERYRRTMYTMFYRSAPYPLLTTFDAPDFSTVCTQRPRSNTPLQSLTLANDAGLFELAQGLALRTVREVPAEAGKEQVLERRLMRMFRLSLSRFPEQRELDLLAGYWQNQKASFEQDPGATTEVAGEKLMQEVSPAEAAAWASVARVLLNTDEFITRD